MNNKTATLGIGAAVIGILTALVGAALAGKSPAKGAAGGAGEGPDATPSPAAAPRTEADPSQASTPQASAMEWPTPGDTGVGQPTAPYASIDLSLPAAPPSVWASDGPSGPTAPAQPAPTGEEGHAAPDLASDVPLGADHRAPPAFRPDMDAPMTAAEREALRPATGPSPSLVSDEGGSVQGVGGDRG